MAGQEIDEWVQEGRIEGAVKAADRAASETGAAILFGKREQVDRSKLAMLMLRWEHVKRDLDDMARKIEAQVLALGETVVTGNVRATYSKGRRVFDYKGVEPHVDEDLIELYTETVERTDWRAVCKAAGFEPEVLSEGSPSVRVKVDKKGQKDD